MDGNKGYDEELLAIFENFANFEKDDEDCEGNSGNDEKNYAYETESEDENMSAFDKVIGYDTIKGIRTLVRFNPQTDFESLTPDALLR